MERIRTVRRFIPLILGVGIVACMVGAARAEKVSKTIRNRIERVVASLRVSES